MQLANSTTVSIFHMYAPPSSMFPRWHILYTQCFQAQLQTTQVHTVCICCFLCQQMFQEGKVRIDRHAYLSLLHPFLDMRTAHQTEDVETCCFHISCKSLYFHLDSQHVRYMGDMSSPVVVDPVYIHCEMWGSSVREMAMVLVLAN